MHHICIVNYNYVRMFMYEKWINAPKDYNTTGPYWYANKYRAVNLMNLINFMPCKSPPSRQLSGNRCWVMSLPFWPPNTWHWHCFRSMAQMATGRTEVQGPYHGPSMIQCSPVQNLVRTRLQAHAAHARMNAIEVSVWHHPQQDKPLSKELERNLRSWYGFCNHCKWDLSLLD
jgi:hypothetical protein